jgi:hypothetical protein
MSNKITKAQSTTLAVSAFEADIESADIDIPRINIVQKASEIYDAEGNLAPFGSVVVDKTWVIAKGEQELRAIPLVASKAWREDIPYDMEQSPRIVGSLAEKRELERESEFKVIEFAEISLLIKGTEDDPEAFPLPIGKDYYAIGRMNVAKDAYRQTFKRLFTFNTFNPNVGIHTREWNFKSTALTRGKYSWYAPHLAVSSDESSKEAQEFVERFLG